MRLRGIGNRARGGRLAGNAPVFSSYPLASGYGPARYFPASSIATGTGVSLAGESARLTIGATTGNLIMGGNATMPVVPGETIAVWFEALVGTPTTASIRFVTSSGSNIGASNTNLTASGSFYKLEVAVPATAAFVNFFCTNTAGSAIVITRPAIAVQGTFTYSDGTDGNVWLTVTAGRVSGTGTVATLDTETRRVVMPSGAIQYARCDLNQGAGKNFVVAIKLSSDLVRRVLFLFESDTQKELENWGGGWWGRRISTAGTVTSAYAQFNVDNTTSAYYTADTVTVERAFVYEGTEYPGAAPAGEVAGDVYSRDEVFVQQGPGQINFFIPGSNLSTAKYTRYQFREYTGAPGSGEGWNFERIHETSRTADEAFQIGDNLTDGGEHLLAVREAGANFIGGELHGHQYGVSEALTIDGVSQTIDGSTNFRCEVAVLTLNSQLRRISDATPLFDVLTVVTVTSAGLQVRNQLTPLLDGLDIVICYSHMLSMSRRKNLATTGADIFNAYTNSLGGSGAATSSGNIPSTFDSTADTWTLTGTQGLTASLQVTSGWGANGDSWLQSASSSNKIYFNPTGYFVDTGPGRTINMVDVIDTTALYNVTSAN